MSTTRGQDWQSAEYVQNWVSRAEKDTLERARRIEQYNLVTDLLPFESKDRFRVVDLGCGWGALLQAVLTAFPNATGVGLDSSPVMLALGQERLAELGDRVTFVLADLEDAGCLKAIDGEISAIVSSRAIYPLVNERKKALYQELYARLLPGGRLITIDHVRVPDPSLLEAYQRVRIHEVERAARAAGLEKPTEEMLAAASSAKPTTKTQTPLVDQLAWLEEIGFRSVDVYWKYLGTAVFGGVKM